MNYKGKKESTSIELIIYDFDGVLTDNRVLVDQYGNESVFANRGDGYGIARIKELGILQVIVSTETNAVVERRAEKLGIEVIHGVENKQAVVADFCNRVGIAPKNAMFIGNDLNDYDAMLYVGIRGCPKDAEKEILSISEWISNANGGYGVARDLYRYLSEKRYN